MSSTGIGDSDSLRSESLDMTAMWLLLGNSVVRRSSCFLGISEGRVSGRFSCCENTRGRYFFPFSIDAYSELAGITMYIPAGGGMSRFWFR